MTFIDTGHNIIPVTWLSYLAVLFAGPIWLSYLAEWWRSGKLLSISSILQYHLYYNIIYTTISSILQYHLYYNTISNFIFFITYRENIVTNIITISSIPYLLYHLLYHLYQTLSFLLLIEKILTQIPVTWRSYLAVLFGGVVAEWWRSGGGVVEWWRSDGGVVAE